MFEGERMREQLGRVREMIEKLPYSDRLKQMLCGML